MTKIEQEVKPIHPNVQRLLETDAGLSQAEVENYFTVTETPKETILQAHDKYMESATLRALQNIARKTGGTYAPKTGTFTIPHAVDAVQVQPTTKEAMVSLIAEALQIAEATATVFLDVTVDDEGFRVKPKENLPADYVSQLNELATQFNGTYFRKERCWVFEIAKPQHEATCVEAKSGGAGKPEEPSPFSSSSPDRGSPTIPVPPSGGSSHDSSCRSEQNLVPSSVGEGTPATQEEDEKDTYSLAVSGEGLGELYPVLRDAHGNIIDGFHRKGEKPQWHEEIRPQIDTPIKLELARLAVNFNRRKVSAAELTQRITFLVRAGLKPEDIAKETGISERTISKYIPQEFKDQKKVKAGQTVKTYDSAEDVQHTVKTPDTAEHDVLVDALDTANYPACPQCRSDPVNVYDQLPYVTCKNGHVWSVTTGTQQPQPTTTKPTGAKPQVRSELPTLVKCSGCGTNVPAISVDANGVCRFCQNKAQQPQAGFTQASASANKPGPELMELAKDFVKCPTCGYYTHPTKIVNGKCSVCNAVDSAKTALDKQPPITQMENEEPEPQIKIPCLTCANDTENGGDCQRIYFVAAEEEGYVCSRKKPLAGRGEAQTTDSSEATVPPVPVASPTPTQKPVKEINWNSQGCNCPLCYTSLSAFAYQRVRNKFGEEYPRLFQKEA